MFVISRSLVMALLLSAAPHYSERDTTDPAVKEFVDRVQHYWNLHKKIEKAVTPMDNKQEQTRGVIVDHQ